MLRTSCRRVSLFKCFYFGLFGYLVGFLFGRAFSLHWEGSFTWKEYSIRRAEKDKLMISSLVVAHCA